MRMSVDEAFQFAAKLKKFRAEIKKEAMDDAKSVLNQHRQEMQVRVTALANEVQGHVGAGVTATAVLLGSIAQKIHDLTQEGK